MTGSSSTIVRTPPDTVAARAVEVARAAVLDEVGPGQVGEHLDAVADGDRVVTHLFACTRPGYTGWQWSVTVARAYRRQQVTVDEVVLVPGVGAIVAPGWVPYRERIQPGDMSPGDLLPVSADDARLVPTYSFGDDDLDADAKAQVRDVAKDLGLGRVRTLSPEGRDLAAERWWDGPGGPESPIAQASPESCWSCGFLVRLSGSLAPSFGVCANGDANDDGRVVALGHGCGAHSEVALAKKYEPLPMPDHVLDTRNRGDLETF